MPTVFTHAFAAVAAGRVYTAAPVPPRFWLLSALCAALPDADVVGFSLGVRYGDLFGHRGFTHSLLFALMLGGAVVALFFRRPPPGLTRAGLVCYFFLATASHGLLDALTNGGLGVAFFAPFDDTRYFFPFRPVRVSPIGVGGFFSPRGLAVVLSELLWIWLPAALLVMLARVLRKWSAAGKT